MESSLSRLTDGILILNPAAEDNSKFEDFHQSLIYLVNHGETGAVGVNLNKFYSQTVDKLSETRGLPRPLDNKSTLVPNIIAGGPLNEGGPWVLQPSENNYEVAIGNQYLCLAFSDDAFEALSVNSGQPAVVGVGTVGWGEGQLERELAHGLWQYLPSDYDLLASIPFNDPPLFAVHLLLQLKYGKSPVRQ
ncbi:YqgE/AlgH family protein [Hahella sp. CCB-MM4]|uniref:YqgE/AlgH family protein n=1 Tax=Hahella sp. (strain CCB-MM4) TaxID=1926491 RepID=UPI000B9BFEAB|nr:YqgE/AlgH family protein [Hahella sp. CCB-MM4]